MTNARSCRGEDVIPDGKILFRSITPLPESQSALNTAAEILLVEGGRHGESYRLTLAYASSYQQARSGLLAHWSDEQIFAEHDFSRVFLRQQSTRFLVVDSLAESNEVTQCATCTKAQVEVHVAAVHALILHHGGLGPYMENTWYLRLPYSGIGRSSSLVSMNRSFCSSRQMVAATADSFATTFRYLLDAPQDGSQFGRILGMAREAISGSFRTLDPAHALALLAIAFESLFSKKEKDFSGACGRINMIVGVDYVDAMRIKKALDNNDDSVRKIRNSVMHGKLLFSGEQVDAARSKLAGYLGLATVFLIQHADEISCGDYYSAMQNLVDKRNSELLARSKGTIGG